MTDEASQRQIVAAEPTASTWLSANAGSGKTRVLTDRVARLLLRGVEPQRILCLTYTKAAASEMQNRLFDRLGRWAMLEEGALRGQLAELGEPVADDPQLLPRARRLFARAIETPGGLKIQTIHSFCSALLRRFPLEAGVPPDFTETEDRSLHQLRLEVLGALASGPQAERLRDLAAVTNETALESILDQIGKHRDLFADGAAPIDLPAVFDLPADFDEAALLDMVYLGHETALIDALLPPLQASGRNDTKLAEALDEARAPSISSLITLERALLFGRTAKAGPFTAKIGAIPTKAVRPAIAPEVLDGLDALARRVEAARPRRQALAALTRTQALHRFAKAWIPALEAAKAARGWLDFDDLILRARRLLSDPAVAQWVLFKLDGGIDHILIDEAQDTSPEQWRVVELLTQEFTAGHGAREAERTIFVVGDKKQSIYSFQGADLRGFDRMRATFDAALADIGRRLTHMELTHSFRSSDAILRLVDHCFAPETGTTGMGGTIEHLAFHDRMAGRVDLWPMVPPAGSHEDGDWDEPLDRPSERNHEVVLAHQIADEIRAMIDRGEQIEDAEGPRPVHEGDFLILVRRRKLLFNALIRACKANGLEIAGADRLVLGDELAVQDMIALLRFLALPEDDLSLATALRSPLFGWSEDELFRLAHGRDGRYLWERLRAETDQAETVSVLADLRDQTDFLRPYELIERILTRHDRRRHLIARFGPEAEDAIEAFVTLALQYEQGRIPSLDGFLGWLTASDAEIKRQSEAAGRRIRVMTVHGAKGLEAPIVILPDTAERRAPSGRGLSAIGGVPVLRMNKDEAPPAQRAADQAQDDQRHEESDRLLYVALTRAERWLIVAGAGQDTGAGWHAKVARALEAAGAAPCTFPTGTGLRLAHGSWPSPAAAESRGAARRAAEPLAPALLAPVASSAVALPVLSPSRLGGAKALPGEAGAEEAVALRRGDMAHLLLEHLPAIESDARPDTARALLRHFDAPPSEVDLCLSEVLALFDAPELAPILTGAALSEVGISGVWKGRRMFGLIDRLLIAPDRVLAVDFKTNRVVPGDAAQVPEGLLRQMGAYAQLLAPLYPDRPVETALVWTATRQVMPIPGPIAAQALARAALDPGVAAS
ncbi:MAG: double-strand break repair helicase AddA [Rhodobacteraceae bacterium HLUCCA12]|nr:MAG: double-strand break repair helicase AddA [Rhodobacteraceae bacterium HLUCCA12]